MDLGIGLEGFANGFDHVRLVSVWRASTVQRGRGSPREARKAPGPEGRSDPGGGHQPRGLSMPCMPSQLEKAENQPVLVVLFWYMPKPWPPCS